MQATRHIFETTIGKILLPWVNLGLLGALVALASEIAELFRSASI